MNIDKKSIESIGTSCLTSIVVFIICFFAIGSNIMILQVLGLSVLLLFLLVGLWVVGYDILYPMLSSKEKERRKKITERIAHEEKRNKEREISFIRKRIQKYNDDVESFTKQFGNLSAKVDFAVNYYDYLHIQCKNLGIISEDNKATEDKVTYHEICNCFNRPLLVFEESSVLVVDDKVYPFNDIIGYSVLDNGKTIMSDNRTVTKTNTGNMLGRAIVGGLVGGGVGAAVGAITANKESTTSQYETTKQHDYVIYIIVNDLSNPNIEIKLYTDTNKCKKIEAILSVILKRKNK